MGTTQTVIMGRDSYLPLLPYKGMWHEYNLLAANVKSANIKVKKDEGDVHVSYNKCTYRHDDVDNYCTFL